MSIAELAPAVLAQAPFTEQATTEVFAQSVFYWVATAAVILFIGGLALVDVGLVRRKNVLDTFIQKMTAALIGGFAFTFIGYGIWEWQFSEAFAVPNALGTSIESWWLGGTFLTQFATNIDPEAAPGADVLQIFFPFNIAFAAAICALVHSIGIERMKPSAMYIMSAVLGGIIIPFVLYLTWGSVSPLTSAGTHDFIGTFALYIFVGFFGIVLAWRLGPRIGSFRKTPRTGPVAHHLGFTGAGVVLLLLAIPLVALGCGYWVPESGYFGIAMTSSGFGIVLTNVIVAFCGGAVGGAIVAYWRKNLVLGMLGPLAGYVSCSVMFDVLLPWETMLISFFAPLAVYFVYWLLVDRQLLDERKVIALTLGAGIYGIVVTSLFAWGTPTGGFFGIEEGPFAFQGAEINLWWQLIGIAVTGGIAIVSALILVIGLEKTIGIRVDEETELRGLDWRYWGGPGVTTGEEPGLPTVADQLRDAAEAGHTKPDGSPAKEPQPLG